MGLFGGTKLNGELDPIRDEITKLTKEVAGLRGERDANKDIVKMSKDYALAKKELTDLQIELDRVKETHSRETREIEHKLGLHRKSVEFDTEAAGREAKLSVREENLKAQEARFEEHVKFIETRFDQQFKSLEKLTGQILERMPTTKQLIHVGTPNGSSKDDD